MTTKAPLEHATLLSRENNNVGTNHSNDKRLLHRTFLHIPGNIASHLDNVSQLTLSGTTTIPKGSHKSHAERQKEVYFQYIDLS